ncbi:MAG: FKBP-type peptidyl-prolyl cis-trans isomerase [Opitutaceae bacterium]|nr:FKBP-type peptidyl-prolyl cis-trans isomerase [Opitutaceae bacterium]
MKLNLNSVLALLALAAAPAVSAQEIKLNIPGKTDAPAPVPAVAATPAPAPANVPPAAAAPAPATFSEDQILETFGWFVAGRIGVHELQFSPEQIAVFTRGVAQAAAGKDAPYDLGKIGPVMNEFIMKRQEAALNRIKEQNMADAVKFFAEVKQKPGVKVLPSGLVVEVTQPGTGPSPKATDTATIHYTGALLSGIVFDTTANRGQPIEIPLDKVIPGWTEGVQQLNKGAKAKLYIPAHLAYGDEGAGEIPPGAALVFDVELVDFKATPAEPAPAPAPAAK